MQVTIVEYFVQLNESIFGLTAVAVLKVQGDLPCGELAGRDGLTEFFHTISGGQVIAAVCS